MIPQSSAITSILNRDIKEVVVRGSLINLAEVARVRTKGAAHSMVLTSITLVTNPVKLRVMRLRVVVIVRMHI